MTFGNKREDPGGLHGEAPDLPVAVEIVEVSPRDGLQNEQVIASTEDKLALIDRAIAAGVRRIEVTSFVNPQRVPQMADAELVAAGLKRRPGVVYIGLALNDRGANRAIATGMDEVGAVAMTTDTFGVRNQGQTSADSVEVACRIVRTALLQGRAGQGTIAAAFGCPFEGQVERARVLSIARSLADAGSHEICLADTIGVATPAEVDRLVRATAELVSPLPVRVHFHNTRNSGLANVWAAARAGARTVDASIGGIGGCPFSPGASGNVPTEDVVYLLERSGVRTELDLERLVDASRWLAGVVRHSVPGMVGKAAAFPPRNADSRPA